MEAEGAGCPSAVAAAGRGRVRKEKEMPETWAEYLAEIRRWMTTLSPEQKEQVARGIREIDADATVPQARVQMMRRIGELRKRVDPTLRPARNARPR